MEANWPVVEVAITSSKYGIWIHILLKMFKKNIQEWLTQYASVQMEANWPLVEVAIIQSKYGI
jgi:hypothetical protein